MFLAKFYDLIWNENLGDTPLLTEFISSSAGSLVDLGCATGRVLSLAKQLNRRAIGIDQYPTMLELANEKLSKINVGTFRLINDDFCKLRLDEPFELVTCVANTFTMIVDSSKRLSLIKLIYERLPSRGKFLIWFMNDTGNFSTASQMQFATPEGTLSYARNVIEDEIKRTRNYTLTLMLNEISEVYSYLTAMISTREMLSHAKLAGFKKISLKGDLNGADYSKESIYQVYIFEK